MIRSFARGVLIGTACICLLALGWLFLFRPSLAQYEASELKEAFTESDPGGNSGVLSLPWFNAENEKQLDLASLQAQYPDVQAWLSIPGTRVDYPVLQSSMENPEYYLRRNYKGEWRTAGSLFLQSDCRLSGKTLIVYAHNMNDGSMFGCLTLCSARSRPLARSCWALASCRSALRSRGMMPRSGRRAL